MVVKYKILLHKTHKNKNIKINYITLALFNLQILLLYYIFQGN